MTLNIDFDSVESLYLQYTSAPTHPPSTACCKIVSLVLGWLAVSHLASPAGIRLHVLGWRKVTVQAPVSWTPRSWGLSVYVNIGESCEIRLTACIEEVKLSCCSRAGDGDEASFIVHRISISLFTLLWGPDPLWVTAPFLWETKSAKLAFQKLAV